MKSYYLVIKKLVCTRKSRRIIKYQKQSPRGVPRKRCSENMQQIYKRTPMPKGDFNKAALQIYWNCFLAWVFSCMFAAYFHNTFSQEHLWVTASAYSWYIVVAAAKKAFKLNFFNANLIWFTPYFIQKRSFNVASSSNWGTFPLTDHVTQIVKNFVIGI